MEESVRVVFLVDVSPRVFPNPNEFHVRKYARLATLSCLRVLNFFHLSASSSSGTSARPVSWTYRFYQRQPIPVKKLAKPTQLPPLTPFDADDVLKLEDLLVDRMRLKFAGGGSEGDDGRRQTRRPEIVDLSFHISSLAEDNQWEAPDMSSPSTTLRNGRVFSAGSRRSGGGGDDRHFVFVVQPIPCCDVEWKQLWGLDESAGVVKLQNSLFPSPLPRLLAKKHMRVLWLDTSAHVSEKSFDLMSKMNLVLSLSKGSVIPASSMVYPLFQPSSSATTVIPPSTILEALIYPTTPNRTKAFTQLRYKNGRRILCYLELASLRNKTKSRLPDLCSLKMESSVHRSVLESFLALDFICLDESMICTGYQTIQHERLRQQPFNTNPQSPAFRDLMSLLHLKQICLILESSAQDNEQRYLLEPVTGCIAALHPLKRAALPSTNLPEEAESSWHSQLGKAAFSSIFLQPWFAVSPDYGVSSSQREWLLKEIPIETPWDDCRIKDDLRLFYEKLLPKGKDSSENVGAGREEILENLLSQYEDIVQGQAVNSNGIVDSVLCQSLTKAMNCLTALGFDSKKELADFLKSKILLPAEQLKSTEMDKEAKTRVYQAQVILRFELSLASSTVAPADELIALLRAYRFLVAADNFQLFLNTLCSRYVSTSLRSSLQSVFDALMLPFPDELLTPGKRPFTSEGSPASEDRLSVSSSSLSFQSAGPSTGPAAPQPSSSSRRKFTRHKTFHDFGRQREISLRHPRAKPITANTSRSKRTQSQVAGSSSAGTASSFPSAKKVRRNLFKEPVKESRRSTRSKRCLTSPLSPSATQPSPSPSKRRVTESPYHKTGTSVIVSDTPPPKQRYRSKRVVAAEEDRPATVSDTPKRNFYSKTSSVASPSPLLGDSMRRWNSEKRGQQKSSPTVASSAHGGAIQDGGGAELAVGCGEAMAQMMFRQQELELGPSVNFPLQPHSHVVQHVEQVDADHEVERDEEPVQQSDTDRLLYGVVFSDDDDDESENPQ